MKQIILSGITLLGTFATAFSQTTLRINNNTNCTIYAFVYETTPSPACGAISLGIPTIPPWGFVDVMTATTSAEFKVEISGAGRIPDVFTDPGCGPQISTSVGVFSCTPTPTVGTSTVVNPPVGPVDKEIDVSL